ncbi:hypothetical protein BT_0401 [Bacteroides thetaiotaomicron VPI-5482]|uniref:Uncharacterized protein n=1 Tax=Bacteroides thetaiotaomicron (strain ATCC 29148 / DSM 2079 / JCM 5827 / CCUG 10774 / NCTC 10582 / VPI-5482 / E50) TaxID=226186 RepID=Q8AAR3_BACTN|nr:hypothetical protein BT_0401 [Bacteroides thetaiotaomicron VPI-5482]DAW06992.1 MAG TPA: hypothetical protein [Caudoviricetes sp.]
MVDIYASSDEVYLLKREQLYQGNTFGLSLVYCSISLQNQVDSLYLYAWFISNKDTKLFTHFLRFFHILFQIY